MGKCFQSLFCLILMLDVCWCVKVVGIRDESVASVITGGVVTLHAESTFNLRLFGDNFTESSSIKFTDESAEYGRSCDDLAMSGKYSVHTRSSYSAIVTANIDSIVPNNGSLFYLCLRSDGGYIHQGADKWLTILLKPPVVPAAKSLLPLPLQITIIAVLLLMSGLFSGLNLGLMSLDPMDLQIVMKSGTKSERRYASLIYPVRKKGNFLLCTLLLGNVLVNNTLTILLGDLTSGVMAVIGSTAGIVVFGEIVPQALCSRYGLHVGAYTIWLTKIFMVLTFILSYPISKILDFILGKEIGTIYNRVKLLEMLKLTDPYNDLAKDEVNIIQGALELRSKTVEDVMTPIADCFMIDIKSTLDFQTMREIMSTGYTRIPVFDVERTNITSILFVKDLAFVDPDDCMPLRTVCKFYQHPLNFVFNDITLDKLLDEFKTGTFHMAIVHRVNNEGPGDPYYEVIGIITMEDVIEEIIKSEIIDETDVYTDNKTKKLNVMRQAIPVDLSLFSESGGDKKPRVSPQLTLAALRFLRAEVEPFKIISEKVLLRLLKQDVVVVLKLEEHDNNRDKLLIYQQNVASDYFVLVLEGQVKVKVGKENLEFDSGPFTYYGTMALMPAADVSTTSIGKKSHRNNSLSSSQLSPETETPSTPDLTRMTQHFVPDYALIATTDVKFIKVSRKQYLNAIRATRMAEDSQSEAATETQPPVTEVPSLEVASKNNNNEHNNDEDDGSCLSQSHPDLARQRAPYLQSKSVSSGHLMAIAAKYANVAGDRVHHGSLIMAVNSPRPLDENLETQSLKSNPGASNERTNLLKQ
uniref:metal transporter CNNM4 isoform X2 n=1 Tax=Ciona intestinalis TaxID=7719 RepID=UPI000180B97F|nr:metal transporter CNNM4 isoform X2 [Ciona intestinalis]|eukprot:XP_009861982.1 metal transporter CNNM4 isoform X2 [Ciona intestinalis]